LLSILPILLPAATPGVLGCLMPVSILSTRVLRNWSSLEIWTTIHEPILTTLFVAAAAGLTVVSIALVLVWTIRTESNPAIRFFARVSSLGYALPGGVLGLGLLIFLAPLYLTGTLVGLLYGYSVRFATIGTSSIEARWQSIPTLYESQARLLGCSAAGAFFRVTLPLLQRSILCAFVLTTIDVIKELPATMLLRPFNVETLAIRTYNLASDERLAETAPSSLAMVLLCAAGVFAAQKLGAFSVGEDGNRGEKNDRKTSLT
jgi:iron(III) transport system permease protein